MPKTQSTVRVKDLAGVIADPTRGVVSLVGDNGGLSLINGEVVTSNLIPGTIAIETEHGVIRLPEDEHVTISEATPYTDQHEWLVQWSIDGYGSTPERAAARVWRDQFGRTSASNDDACFFTVSDAETHEVVSIDLSEFDFDELLD